MPTPTSTAAARLSLTVTSHKTGVTCHASVVTADIRVGTFLLTVRTSVGVRAPREGRFLVSATGCTYMGGDRQVVDARGFVDSVALEGEALAEITNAAAYMWAELRDAALEGRKSALAAKVAELELEGDLDTAGKISGWLAAA